VAVSIGLDYSNSSDRDRRSMGFSPDGSWGVWQPKRSGGRRNPTAVPEVDRGLPDGLKVRANLRIGV
jgi:hypothetical protein